MLIEVIIAVVEKSGVMPSDWRWAERRAALLFGGYTWREWCQGGWIAPDDTTTAHCTRDDSRELVIGVDTLSDLALAVAFAREIGTRWGEQSVYVRCLGMAECVECRQ